MQNRVVVAVIRKAGVFFEPVKRVIVADLRIAEVFFEPSNFIGKP